jgi:hypothetical protein
MPRRSRRQRATFDLEAELFAWDLVFEAGHDYLGDLVAYRVPWGEKVPLDLAREMWRKIGAEWLERRQPKGFYPWALETFGPP